MRQAYKDIKLAKSSLALVAKMNPIIASYKQQGYMLTVRQLYYQLVARDIVENTLQSYKRVASIINDARVGGYMDWDSIEDRTRDVSMRSRWISGASGIRALADQYHMDLWEGQPHRLFVIVEKEALVGVMQRVCHKYDVPLLAARGYPSVTIVRDLALDHLMPSIHSGQEPIVLHLGDHDPSGIDMTRDLNDRLDMFLEDDSGSYELRRIALNMAQVRETNAPPNPAKSSDSRFEDYMKKFGTESWELDALEPSYLDELVTLNIERYIEFSIWGVRQEEIRSVQTRLHDSARQFEETEG